MTSPRPARPPAGLRIIAGRFRGRALIAPPGETTRPTAVRLRQAAFDILAHAPWGGAAALDGARVLDAFAGTGAMGLEAYSRGAASVVFVERDRAALAALTRNVAGFAAGDALRVMAGDFLSVRPAGQFDLIFLDPPYGQDLIARALARIAALDLAVADTVIVTESSHIDFVNDSGLCLTERAHGAGRLRFWRWDMLRPG